MPKVKKKKEQPRSRTIFSAKDILDIIRAILIIFLLLLEKLPGIIESFTNLFS